LNPFFNISTLRLSVLAVCLVLGSPALLHVAFAQSGKSAAQVFDIPAGPPDMTLTQIARQNGQIISIRPAQIQGHKAPAIRGEMNADQAYSRALHGAGLELFVSESGALNLRTLQAETFPTLHEIAVTAQETPASKVYTAPRSSAYVSAEDLDRWRGSTNPGTEAAAPPDSRTIG
jgi:hypothetical protein